MAHYEISSRDSQVLIFYLLVFDRILDAINLSKTCGRKTGPQQFTSPLAKTDILTHK